MEPFAYDWRKDLDQAAEMNLVAHVAAPRLVGHARDRAGFVRGHQLKPLRQRVDAAPDLHSDRFLERAGLPEPAHFETGQARMDVPFWVDLPAYIRKHWLTELFD